MQKRQVIAVNPPMLWPCVILHDYPMKDRLMITFSPSFHPLVTWSKETLSDKYERVECIFNPDKNLMTQNMEEYYRDNQTLLEDKTNWYAAEWSMINSAYDGFLRKYFDHHGELDLSAFLTFFPIYPRDIENKVFLVPYTNDLHYLKTIAIHETLHFAYYSELSYMLDVNEYSDDEIWLLSEVVVPLFFDLIEKELRLEKLKYSSYCFTDKHVNAISGIFRKYALRKIDFSDFFRSAIKLLREVS